MTSAPDRITYDAGRAMSAPPHITTPHITLDAVRCAGYCTYQRACDAWSELSLCSLSERFFSAGRSTWVAGLRSTLAETRLFPQPKARYLLRNLSARSVFPNRQCRNLLTRRRSLKPLTGFAVSLSRLTISRFKTLK